MPKLSRNTALRIIASVLLAVVPGTGLSQQIDSATEVIDAIDNAESSAEALFSELDQATGADAAFDNFAPYYDRLNTSLNALDAAAENAGNDFLSQQVFLLRNSLAEFQKAHQGADGPMDPNTVGLARNGIESLLTNARSANELPLSDQNDGINLLPMFVGVLVLGIAIAWAGSYFFRRPIEGAAKSTQSIQLGESVVVKSSTGELPEVSGPITIERLKIRNFKCIEHMELAFEQSEKFAGRWTCIAGINGAGKTSILQALCLALLGDHLVLDLGMGRLSRMIRRQQGKKLETEITVTVRANVNGQQEEIDLLMPLSPSASNVQVTEYKLRSDAHEYKRMRATWDALNRQVLLAYGATRNLSDQKESRHADRSIQAQRMMTLFDPLTRIAGAAVLVDPDNDDADALKTFCNLLDRLGEMEEFSALRPKRGKKVSFEQRDSSVSAIDLPDGYRSFVAWLADLCVTWHAVAPTSETRSNDPEKISGIVLLDEMGLHLHPSLERSVVSALREALPNVQFVVSTHSPLVLSSFDKSELIVLDQDEIGGIRELDRQIFGFSTDEVYEWLMDTPSQSAVIEEKLKKRDDPDLAVYLYESVSKNEDEARSLRDKRRKILENLGYDKEGEI